jgi:hypothetical protein
MALAGTMDGEAYDGNGRCVMPFFQRAEGWKKPNDVEPRIDTDEH